MEEGAGEAPVEAKTSRSGRSVTWLSYGTPGEASREYAEMVEILRSVQAESWARPTCVKLIPRGEVKGETQVGTTRDPRSEL
jgi:hypothetical protein